MGALSLAVAGLLLAGPAGARAASAADKPPPPAPLPRHRRRRRPKRHRSRSWPRRANRPRRPHRPPRRRPRRRFHRRRGNRRCRPRRSPTRACCATRLPGPRRTSGCRRVTRRRRTPRSCSRRRSTCRAATSTTAPVFAPAPPITRWSRSVSSWQISHYWSSLNAEAERVKKELGALPDSHAPAWLFLVGGRYSIGYGKLMIGGLGGAIHFEPQAFVHVGGHAHEGDAGPSGTGGWACSCSSSPSCSFASTPPSSTSARIARGSSVAVWGTLPSLGVGGTL